MTMKTRGLYNRIFDQFGERIAARLNSSAIEVHPDISERLRLAREEAVARRRIVVLQTKTTIQGHSFAGALILGGGWWTRLSGLMPLAVLVTGLLLISAIGDEQRAHELADVDTELLSDELPPNAYVDPGFIKFLQLKGRD